MKKTQKDMMRDARRRIADKNRAFVDMMNSSNPLTNEEIDKLIEKRPDIWSSYKGKGKT